MNPNTEYEKFTQEIYQQLLNEDFGNIKTVNVLHNVKLKGRSGQEHQIDVYWEYEMVGIMYKTAIECKNYKHPISVGKIRDFYGVLSDLNNVIGIMVTKEGYQKGSKEYARHYGINLKELRQPKCGESIIDNKYLIYKNTPTNKATQKTEGQYNTSLQKQIIQFVKHYIYIHTIPNRFLSQTDLSVCKSQKNDRLKP